MDLGDASKRRRIYIVLIHQKVLRDDIKSNKALEEVLISTLGTMKTKGPPPDPSFVYFIDFKFVSLLF